MPNHKPKGDFYRDRQLGITTGGLEEWAENTPYYHFESTPYRALDKLAQEYTPPKNPILLDYGAGLGRINIYFYDQLKIGGSGLEVHPDRLRRAQENLGRYTKQETPIEFIGEAAEHYEPSEDTTIFYFFNPFDVKIFEETLQKICESLQTNDRTADIILYYPSVEYIRALEKTNHFQHHQLIDLPWTFDERDCFIIYRHEKAKRRFKISKLPIIA